MLRRATSWRVVSDILPGVRNVAVLLCGCGAYDGSDVHETVLLALALRRRGLRARFLAPDTPQADVVDHTRGDTEAGAAPRGALAESARLARGTIQSLSEVAASELDALVIPGGMGVVRTLCFDPDAPLGGGAVRADVADLLDALAARHVPIAAVGLGRVVIERHRGSAADAAALNVAVQSVVTFGEPEVLFTPGFLASDCIDAVGTGIDRLVDELARRLGVVPALRARVERD